MDVNGSRFHILIGEADWRPLTREGAESVVWDGERKAVSLLPKLFLFPSASSAPRLAARRGAARDRFGNWYWLGEDEAGHSEIRFSGGGQRPSERFWPVQRSPAGAKGGAFSDADPLVFEPPQLRGLAITCDHLLVVGSLVPAGLLVFDLHAGGAPLDIRWPAGVPFSPCDMAPRPGGGVWILDHADGGPARTWTVDRQLQVVPTTASIEIEAARQDAFAPDGGEPRTHAARLFPSGIELSLSSPVAALNPVAIEALPDCSVLILDSDASDTASTVFLYRNETLLTAISLANVFDGVVAADATGGDLDLLAQDMAFLPDSQSEPAAAGTLFVADARSEQSFAFRLTLTDSDLLLELCRDYFPMRLFGGKALVTSNAAVYYDLGERWTRLARQPKPRYESCGRLAPRVFDGRDPGCVWHRLFVDACIPPGSRVRVQTRAADQREHLDALAWDWQPDLYLRRRGRELPFQEEAGASGPSRPGAGTWELLIQNARGRFIEVCLHLEGSGRSSPLITCTRLHYPRFSYLDHYLPRVYRDDTTSASFVDRLLANPEGTLTEIEGRIADVQALFDVRSVPDAYLEWLGGWLGALLDPAWDTERRRLFIAHAPQIYRERGTVRGLLRLLRLATDPCPSAEIFLGGAERRGGPRIVERFAVRDLPAVVLGDPTQEQPRVLPSDNRWQPQDGVAALHAGYRAWLEQRYSSDMSASPSAIEALKAAWDTSLSSFAAINFSAMPPSLPAILRDWRGFVSQGIGFSYAEVTAADLPAFRRFQERRYRLIEAYNDAYQLTGDAALSSFAHIQLPPEGTFPAGEAPAFDWIAFVSQEIPIRRAAHQFTVLVPAVPTDSSEALAARVARAHDVVKREKPAHTRFETRPFWDLFRVGEARLGIDTELGQGSRFAALVLGDDAVGRGSLAHTILGRAHPFDVTDRQVLGRDRLGERGVFSTSGKEGSE
jgi:phage tail-like protein